MEIIQKKKSNKHIFTFKDAYFNFAYEDNSGYGDTDMSYADLPMKSSVRIEQNEWLSNVGYLWCVIGICQLAYAGYSGASLAGKGFWLVVGLGCVVWAYFSKVRYTVFRTDRANIYVIQDKHHDRIIEELNTRRKAQLLQWYGDIDPENDLENEVSKFKWLVEQQVITEEELAQKIAQAELLHVENLALSSELLN